MPLTTKTFIIPVTVEITYQQDRIQQEAQFISCVIRDKVRKSLDQTSTVNKWSVDKPNETDIVL